MICLMDNSGNVGLMDNSIIHLMDFMDRSVRYYNLPGLMDKYLNVSLAL